MDEYPAAPRDASKIVSQLVQSISESVQNAFVPKASASNDADMHADEGAITFMVPATDVAMASTAKAAASSLYVRPAPLPVEK